MVIIELRFSAGRFHATPWGRHVNEGVPEWPPSPFRLIRALYDVWKKKASDVPEAEIEALFSVIASMPPEYALPRASAAHTRLYLRQGGREEADKNLVFDPFVVVMPTDPVLMGWPSVELPEAQQRLLAQLLDLMSYLGRAESLVRARLADKQGAARWNCRPVGSMPEDGGESEIERVACVIQPGKQMRLEVKEERNKKRTLGWLEALTWGSAETLARRLSDPPALRWVDYRRKRGALELQPGAPARNDNRKVDAALFSLHGNVLPLVFDAVSIGEQFRVCAMGSGRRIGNGDPAKVSPLLSGKDAEGNPLIGHPHAYYLPLDKDGDGRIDHVLVRCKLGLNRREQLSLAEVRYLWQRKDKPTIQIVEIASGMHAEVLDSGRIWTSATPFVSPRHHKASRGAFERWIDEELRRALEQHGLPAPKRIESVDQLKLAGGRRRRWIEFRRARKDEAPKLGYGFRIEFETDVLGPFAVGYASHFGLGIFRKER